MVNSVRFFSVLENGHLAYDRVYESNDVSALAMSYLVYLTQEIGLNSVTLTVMCEAKFNVSTRSSVFGHFLIQGGKIFTVNPDFARLVREVDNAYRA
jgi:hypothetical protein